MFSARDASWGSKRGATSESVEFVASKLDAEAKFCEFYIQLPGKKHILRRQISVDNTFLVAIPNTRRRPAEFAWSPFSVTRPWCTKESHGSPPLTYSQTRNIFSVWFTSHDFIILGGFKAFIFWASQKSPWRPVVFCWVLSMTFTVTFVLAKMCWANSVAAKLPSQVVLRSSHTVRVSSSAEMAETP